MNTKVSPNWIFGFLIFATMVVGVALRFASPAIAGRLVTHPPKFLGTHVTGAIQRHRDIIDGSAEIAKGLGEALFIAAVLAAIVDPYAKFRLGKEIGREIAHETAGQHLPDELRQALERIQDIDLYQLHMIIDITLDKVDAVPGYLKWQTDLLYEIKNASWNKHTFEHRVSITDSAAERHDGRIIAVSHSVDNKVQYSFTDPSPELQYLLTRTDGTTLFKHPDARRIASTRLASTHKYEYASTTEHFVPHSEIQVIQVHYPTVGIDLTVHHPPEVAIHTSLQYVDEIKPKTPDGEVGHTTRWQSERAYLTNEHIWIMYEIDDGNPDSAQMSDSSISQTKPAPAG